MRRDRRKHPVVFVVNVFVLMPTVIAAPAVAKGHATLAGSCSLFCCFNTKTLRFRACCASTPVPSAMPAEAEGAICLHRGGGRRWFQIRGTALVVTRDKTVGHLARKTGLS